MAIQMGSKVLEGAVKKMHENAQKFILTKTQKVQFERDGFIVVKNVLSGNELKKILAVVNTIWEKYRSRNSDDYLHMFDFLNQDKIFMKLLDYDKILPLVLGLLGWNIYLYHSHLDVNLPIKQNNAPGLTWHRDNSRMNYDFKNGRYPLVALKVAYWLSDVSEKNRGNLYVIPGSHKWTYNQGKTIKNNILPEKAIPLIVKPGTVVFFDSRIWHTRGNNFSKITRKVLFFGYSYRWLRPRDNAKISAKLLEMASPIQRQLLIRDIDNGAYVPKDKDVPLKELYSKLYPSDYKQQRSDSKY